jgi:hypothetical protein
VSPGREYAVGCLTNYKMIIFGKASISDDKFTYEICELYDIIKQYWKFLHCDGTHLGHVTFSIPHDFNIESVLGKY